MSQSNISSYTDTSVTGEAFGQQWSIGRTRSSADGPFTPSVMRGYALNLRNGFEDIEGVNFGDRVWFHAMRQFRRSHVREGAVLGDEPLNRIVVEGLGDWKSFVEVPSADLVETRRYAAVLGSMLAHNQLVDKTSVSGWSRVYFLTLIICF